MPTTLACPRCGVVAVVHLDRDPIEVGYNHDHWSRLCAHPGVDGLTLCPEVLKSLRLLLGQAGRAPNGPIKDVIRDNPEGQQSLH
jgi:hypothetical protein